jgi:PilZ domain
MALSTRTPKNFAIPRREPRMPMEIGVHISGHAELPGTETTFTENVSMRGLRVLSARRWKTDDRLTVTTPAGSFQSIARVAYCQTVSESGFAVGLEILERSGTWIVDDQPN